MISVLSAPIFRVQKSDGLSEWVGLRSLILNAHTYADLQGRTPTGRCALLRLCIAFLEDMLRPEDLKARRALFQKGHFDADALERYIAECEKEGLRFLLDDPQHPFMQMPYDPSLDANAEKPIAVLVMDAPSGNNSVHFDHRMETDHVLNAADAFEALLETYLFCPAGTAGPSNINNTPPIYFIIRGRNLFETLVLNMVSAGDGEELDNIPFGMGEVPWRSGTIIHPRERVMEMNYLRAMTWQPRRATLKFDENGWIHSCYLQPGLDFRGDGRWRDPQTAYFLKKDQTWGTLKPEAGRRVWRDVGDLLMGSDTLQQPVTVANCSKVWRNVPNGMVEIEAIGLQTNQAACIGWTQEMLRLPEVFLQDADMARAFRDCVDICEKIVNKMTKTISDVMDAQVTEQACAQFLRSMYDELFDHTMYRILRWEESWQSKFAKSVRKSVKTALEQAVNRSGSSVKMLKLQGQIEGIMMWFTNERLKGW